jgi:hypothetical protein
MLEILGAGRVGASTPPCEDQQRDDAYGKPA